MLRIKFDKYASLFRQVLKKSDEIMVENILLGDYRTKSNRLQTSDVKKENEKLILYKKQTVIKTDCLI